MTFILHDDLFHYKSDHQEIMDNEAERIFFLSHYVRDFRTLPIVSFLRQTDNIYYNFIMGERKIIVKELEQKFNIMTKKICHDIMANVLTFMYHINYYWGNGKLFIIVKF